MLLGVFIYWGWDSAVAVNEETEDPASRRPGRSAVVSTLILVGIYVLVTSRRRPSRGPKLLIDNPDDVLRPLGERCSAAGSTSS